MPIGTVGGARGTEIGEWSRLRLLAAATGAGFEVERMWRSSTIRRRGVSGRWAMIGSGIASGHGFAAVRGTVIA